MCLMRGLVQNGYQAGYVAGVLRRHGGHRSVLPETRHRCQRLCAGWAVCRTMAHRLRLRHLLLLRRSLCGIRRAVWVEVRYCRHLGGHRQRYPGLSVGLGRAGPPDSHHDPAPGLRHHARIFWQAVWLQVPEGRRLSHYLHLPYPLHRQSVQRPVQAVRHGL